MLVAPASAGLGILTFFIELSIERPNKKIEENMKIHDKECNKNQS